MTRRCSETGRQKAHISFPVSPKPESGRPPAPSSHFGGEWRGGETGARRQLTGRQPARRRSRSKEEGEDQKGGGGRRERKEEAEMAQKEERPGPHPRPPLTWPPAALIPPPLPRSTLPPSQLDTAIRRGEAPGFCLSFREQTSDSSSSVCALTCPFSPIFSLEELIKGVSASRETELCGLPVT